jgi:hypothetical protein
MLAHLLQRRSLCGVHRQGDVDNAEQTLSAQVAFTLHEEQNPTELPKIDVFFRLQRMLHKKLADFFQAVQIPDAKAIPVRMISSDRAGTEEPFQGHQNLPIAVVLDHHELGQDLKAYRHFGMPGDADMEAAFGIDESDDPIGTKFHRGSS